MASVKYGSNWNGPNMELTFYDRVNSPQTITVPRPAKDHPDLPKDGGKTPVVYDPKGKYRPVLKSQLA